MKLVGYTGLNQSPSADQWAQQVKSHNSWCQSDDGSTVRLRNVARF